MSIKNNFPTIRPSLNLDFANSKQVDPRITFTRASTATYWDDKTFAKAEENLLLNSDNPLGRGWLIANGSAGSISGAELVTNGGFDSDLSGWTVGSGWTWEGGAAKATNTTGALTQRVGSSGAAKTFLITFNQTIISGSRLRVRIRNFADNTDLDFQYRTGTQNVVIYVPSTDSGITINVMPEAAEVLTIDSVSVKELAADAVSPLGTMSAVKVVASGADATVTQVVTALATEYTFSVYLRRVSGSGDVQISAGGVWVSQNITASWARYSVTQTLAAGSRSAGVRITTSGDEVEVWGAQLEQRSQATSYTPTTSVPITKYQPVLQTAASGVPRIDHDPVTGECKGLLIEEQRTNLLTYSSDFSNAAWTKTNTTVDSNSAIAPDGTPTGDKLVAASGSAAHGIVISVSSPANSAISVYAKYAGQRFIQFHLGQVDQTRAWVNFDILDGVVGTINGAATSATIAYVGNGWYRCSFLRTGGGNVAAGVYIAPSADAAFAAASTGDGYSGIYIWGTQLEAGAFPTSYIPTTTAQVTRAADAASMTGTNFSSWYRQDEGTFFAKAVPMFSSVTVYNDFVEANNGTQSNTFGTISGLVTGHQAGQLVSVAANVVSRARNGVILALTQPTNQPPKTQMQIGVGRLYYPTSGWYQRIAYYPKRLSNAELQALTA